MKKILIVYACILTTAQLKSFPAIDTGIIDIFKNAIRDANFNTYASELGDDARITTPIDEELYPLLEKPLEKEQKSATDQATILIRFILPNALTNAHAIFFDKKTSPLSDGLIANQIAPLSKFNGDKKTARNFVNSYLDSLAKRVTADKQLLNPTKAFAATGNTTAISTLNRYLSAAVLWELEKAVNGSNDPYDLALDIVETFKKDKSSNSLMQTSLYKEALPHTITDHLKNLSQALSALR